MEDKITLLVPEDIKTYELTGGPTAQSDVVGTGFTANPLAPVKIAKVKKKRKKEDSEELEEYESECDLECSTCVDKCKVIPGVPFRKRIIKE